MEISWNFVSPKKWEPWGRSPYLSATTVADGKYVSVPRPWEALSYTKNTFFVKPGNTKVHKGVSEKFDRYEYPTLCISSLAGDFGF